jgi:hypothetical protein
MIDFQVIPEAHASVITLMKSINRVIINPIIFFLFACAMVYFLYGVVQYLLSPGNEEVHKKSKAQMLWGIIGLFIMVAVFGIMRLILNTVGETNIKIQDTGDYQVNEIPVKGSGTTPPNQTSPTLNGGDFSTGIDISTPRVPSQPATFYTTSPFVQKYVDNGLCWRRELYASGATEYKALEAVKIVARNRFLSDNGLNSATTSESLPIVYGVMTTYDPTGKLYYVWQDVRAPIQNGKTTDCNLTKVLQASATLPSPTAQSKKQSSLIGKYQSNTTHYRATDSGVSPVLSDARSIAIKNALIQIAVLKSLPSISGIQYSVVAESYFPADATTANYDYWVVIESLK